MKNILVTLGAFVVALASVQAFETAQSVTATPITSLPFVISSPGNYYLPNDLHCATTGAAIVVNANEVIIDLNGRSLVADGPETSPFIGTGIVVLNHEDVTIQNGDINGFGNAGILLDATDGKKEHNQKNTVRNVNFNDDEIGVQIVSASLDTVEHCDFDGGAVGVYDIASLGGDRFQQDNFENQQPRESLNIGVGVVASPGNGTLTEDCLFADDHYGLILSSAQDKFRFDSFNSDTINHLGGTEEGAGDL